MTDKTKISPATPEQFVNAEYVRAEATRLPPVRVQEEAERQCRLVNEINSLFAILGFGPEQARASGTFYREHVSGAFIESSHDRSSLAWSSYLQTAGEGESICWHATVHEAAGYVCRATGGLR